MQIHQGYLLSRRERYSQGDPKATKAFALGILPLIKFLLEFINLNKMNAKEVDFADEFSFLDSMSSIKDYRNKTLSFH